MKLVGKRVLFVAALRDEVQGELEKAGADVLYVGVGKVNATYHLTRALTERRSLGPKIDLVINVGTAGSSKFPTHSVVECSRFFQRDMDVTALGFAVGQTPYDLVPGDIITLPLFDSVPSASCGSGDNFEKSGVRHDCDVIDMEAFALAKVCQLEGVAFTALKYITDGSDESAHTDWQLNLPRAAQAFTDLYKSSRNP